MATKKVSERRRPGPVTMYPDKVRQEPVSFTAPRRLLDKLGRLEHRKRLTRSDVMCQLLDEYPEPS